MTPAAGTFGNVSFEQEAQQKVSRKNLRDPSPNIVNDFGNADNKPHLVRRSES